MRPDADVVLALDIGGTKLAACLVDSDGRAYERQMIATNPADGAERVLERALMLLEHVRQRANSRELRARALGVSTNGLTHEDHVELAPAVPGWSALQIPKRLRERFALPVAIVNDVKAATLAEMSWGELREVREGLYVNIGTGIAAGLVAGGRLWEGAHGAAGEIGYVVPSLEALDDAGADRAPLEERISGRGVALWTGRELGRELTMAELMQGPASDPAVSGARARLLEELALWVANTAVVVDPERIVLGGGLMRCFTSVCERVQQTVDRVLPFRAEVVPARFGADSSLLGAAVRALRLGSAE